MRHMKSMLLCAAALVAGSATAANALTYVVDSAIGGGSVFGTITTNGTTGTLAAADITGWNLLVTGNGGVSATLDTLNSGLFLDGGAVTADASNIYFDFTKNNAAPSYLLFQQSLHSGNAYVCAANADYALTPCYYGASAVPENYQSGSAAFSVPSGNLIVASIAAVPEPATWAMMIGGLALVGASMRRRSVAVRFA